MNMGLRRVEVWGQGGRGVGRESAIRALQKTPGLEIFRHPRRDAPCRTTVVGRPKRRRV